MYVCRKVKFAVWVRKNSFFKPATTPAVALLSPQLRRKAGEAARARDRQAAAAAPDEADESDATEEGKRQEGERREWDDREVVA